MPQEHPELSILARGLSSLLGEPVIVSLSCGSDNDVAAALKGVSFALLCSPDPDLLAWRDVGDSAEGTPSDLPLGELARAVETSGGRVAWKGYALSDSTHFERHLGVVAVVADGEDRDSAKLLAQALESGIGSFPIVLAAGEGRGATNLPASPTELTRKVRVCIVTNEIFGPSRNGGIGTAYTALAELLAGQPETFDLTVLFNNDPETEQPFAHWEEFYREKGIALVPIPQNRPAQLRWQDEYMWRAWSVARWLRENDRFDIVHFPECNGQGYYAMQAKHCGLAFADTTFCVGTHSSTRWIYECGGERFSSTFQLQLDFMEQRCVELADLVVSASCYMLHWMRNEGWELPAAVVQQNIQPYSTRLADAVGEKPLPLVTGIRELVFFGRIESRKGIHTFCDALDLLNEDSAFRDEVSVTFLGKQVSIDGGSSAELLESRGEDWGFDWQILDDKNQDEAVTYLRGKGRLALMPSPVDNSPLTVLECIGLKIPFLTTRAGGIPELIHPEDLPSTTFYHRDLAERPVILAEKIRGALSDGIRPPRRAIPVAANESAWLHWHRSTVGEESSVEELPLPSYEIMTVAAELPLSDLLEGVSTASDYLLLLDPLAKLLPGAKEALLHAAARTGADFLTGFDDVSETDRHFFPLGLHSAIPLFWNCYGRGLWCVRTEALRTLLSRCPQSDVCLLEGLRSGRLLTHATLLGCSLELVPEVLCDLDVPVISKDDEGCDYPIDHASLATYLMHMPAAADALFNFNLGQQEEAEKNNNELWHLRWKTGNLQEQLDDRMVKFAAAKEAAKTEKAGRKEAEAKAKAQSAERARLQKKLDRRFSARLRRLFRKT